MECGSREEGSCPNCSSAIDAPHGVSSAVMPHVAPDGPSPVVLFDDPRRGAVPAALASGAETQRFVSDTRRTTLSRADIRETILSAGDGFWLANNIAGRTPWHDSIMFKTIVGDGSAVDGGEFRQEGEWLAELYRACQHPCHASAVQSRVFHGCTKDFLTKARRSAPSYPRRRGLNGTESRMMRWIHGVVDAVEREAHRKCPTWCKCRLTNERISVEFRKSGRKCKVTVSVDINDRCIP